MRKNYRIFFLLEFNDYTRIIWNCIVPSSNHKSSLKIIVKLKKKLTIHNCLWLDYNVNYFTLVVVSLFFFLIIICIKEVIHSEKKRLLQRIRRPRDPRYKKKKFRERRNVNEEKLSYLVQYSHLAYCLQYKPIDNQQ